MRNALLGSMDETASYSFHCLYLMLSLDQNSRRSVALDKTEPLNKGK
jgi:hypothetical protein